MTSLKQNLTKTKPPVVKSAWYHTCRSLEKCLVIYLLRALMVFNSTNPYLLKTQVTVIPNFKNKEEPRGSMLVRGNQWKQLAETPQPWMEHGKKAMTE